MKAERHVIEFCKQKQLVAASARQAIKGLDQDILIVQSL